MVFRPSIDARLAFVLMPFKHPFISYYEDIIKPAARAAGLETRKADEIYGTGPIIQDIWNSIWKATAIIADVTGKNPNVNYELGICHALGIPTVIITQSIEDVPFDYQHRRCILYKTDGSTWQRDLRKALSATLKAVIEGEDGAAELGWPYETDPSRQPQQSGTLIPASSARERVLRGIRLVRDATSSAFGPSGTSVSVSQAGGQHAFLKKGTDIANAIHSPEKLERVGIGHAQRLMAEMRSAVGDGSKTSLLLFYKMFSSGSAALRRNHPLRDILRGMERATEAAVFAIRSQAELASDDSIRKVARTAAGGSESLGDLVVDAYKRAGRDGIVVIERTGLLECVLEVQEGMVFDRGYLDTALLTSAEDYECKLDDVYVLIYGLKISSMRDLLPLLEQVAATKKPLLIIADEVEGEALATIVLNRKTGALDCLAVRSPGFGDRRMALLQDIAILTGGTAITPASGRRLDSLTIQDLGRARKVIVTKESTTILGGAGEPNLPKHVGNIRRELSRATDAFSIEKLRERLVKLSGAVASVRIGGISPQEIADRAYHAESSMHSAQRAIEEGVVLGGGVCFLQAKPSLAKLSLKKPGELAGINVIYEALDEPARQLVINGGTRNAEQALRKMGASIGRGFNSATGKVGGLASLGVVDAMATVTRSVQLASAFARGLLEAGAYDAPASEQEAEPDPDKLEPRELEDFLEDHDVE